MSDKIEGGLDYAVSAACFMQTDLITGIRSFGSVVGVPYVPELERTSKVAERLGIGVEVPYRVGAKPQIYEAFPVDGRVRVLQIHGPILASRRRAFDHGWGLLGGMKNAVIAHAILGTAANFYDARNIAIDHGANLVLHPDIARSLDSRAFDLHSEKVGYEADWKPANYHPDLPHVWRVQDAIRDVDRLGIRAIPDTSHHLIGYNPPAGKVGDSLIQMVEGYGDRIIGFHVSGVATEPMNPKSVYDGGGALPLNSRRLSKDHLNGMRAFHDRAVLLAQKFRRRIPFVIEIYGWENGEDREKGVEETLNAFHTTRDPLSTKSLPSSPIK